MDKVAHKFIQQAIKKPGSFTAQAKKASKSIGAYATQVLKKGSKASTTTKKRAILARTLRKLARARKSSYSSAAVQSARGG